MKLLAFILIWGTPGQCLFFAGAFAALAASHLMLCSVARYSLGPPRCYGLASFLSHYHFVGSLHFAYALAYTSLVHTALRPLAILLAWTLLQSCDSKNIESQRQALLLQSLEASIEQTEQLSKSKIQFLRENTNMKTHLRPIYKAAITLSPKADPLLDYLNQLANKNKLSKIQIDSLENLIPQTRDSLVRAVYALHELNQKIQMAGVKFSNKALKHIEKDLLINNIATINYHQLTKKTAPQEIDLLLTKTKLLTISSTSQSLHFFAAHGRGGLWLVLR